MNTSMIAFWHYAQYILQMTTWWLWIYLWIKKQTLKTFFVRWKGWITSQWLPIQNMNTFLVAFWQYAQYIVQMTTSGLWMYIWIKRKLWNIFRYDGKAEYQFLSRGFITQQNPGYFWQEIGTTHTPAAVSLLMVVIGNKFLVGKDWCGYWMWGRSYPK